MKTIGPAEVEPKELGTEHRILVVEDEPELLNLLCDLLEFEGFKVSGAARPDLALSLVGAVSPDLFLIDLMLPGMSGIELAEQLRAVGYATTPMIAISASRLMCNLACEAGIFERAIDKPFDLSTLLECIACYLPARHATARAGDVRGSSRPASPSV